VKPKRSHQVPQLVDVKDAPSEALVRLRMGDAAAALALLREGGPLSPELGAELAALAERSIPRQRGRPSLTAKQRLERAALARFLRWLIELQTTIPPRRAYLEAKENLTAILRLSEGRMNHLLHPEGRVGELAAEMSLYDCYVLLPQVRAAVNEVHEAAAKCAAQCGETVAEFYAALEHGRQGDPPPKP